ncbi:MAG: FAD:protein FMN transferase [Lachnospiraceae bacterium]|nr:FAD:protein FMN transferase [Lachnospiraceae bacterium]
MKNKRIFKITALIMCSILIIGLSSCSCSIKSKEPVTKNAFVLDTVITITLYGENAKEHIDKCIEIANKYDSLLSNNNTNSIIYKINNAEGQFVEVDADTLDVINQGINFGNISDGTLDISIGKLTNLWDIKNRTEPPSQEEINNALGFNYKNIEIDGNKVRLLTEKEQLDLGGIAKGYIADKMKEYLTSQGINQGVINLGGNVVCLDKKNNDEDYKIGIQRPFDESGTPMCAINVSNKSVVTSGDYQRYFEYNGKKYHHIIDVKTGYPADNDLDSVTIINNSSTAGDALSTIAFLYGLDKGMSFIESIPDTEAIFITKDGNLHKTSGITDAMLTMVE